MIIDFYADSFCKSVVQQWRDKFSRCTYGIAVSFPQAIHVYICVCCLCGTICGLDKCPEFFAKALFKRKNVWGGLVMNDCWPICHFLLAGEMIIRRDWCDRSTPFVIARFPFILLKSNFKLFLGHRVAHNWSSIYFLLFCFPVPLSLGVQARGAR